jgi:hypothetical protein
MATLKIQTFPSDQEGQALLAKVQQALSHVTGVGTHKDGVYTAAPRNLNPDRDHLRPNYKAVWQLCTIEYDPDEPGAEVPAGTRTLKIGPFLQLPGTSVTDVEKVILHEYLHLVVDIGWNEGQAQHPQINSIIRDSLKYAGPPNPANPAED